MTTTNYKKLEKEFYDLRKEHQLLKKEQIEFKKEQKNKFRRFVVFMVVLCLIISGITGVASYTLAANQVGYTARDTSWTVDNTQDAIDELRDTVGYALVGSIFSYMGNNAPFGYLACDGTEYNISDYPRLAEHFISEFGSSNYFGGDGSTTFAVPDLRGEFLRGTGTNNTTNLSGANVGQHTNEGLPNITGTIAGNTIPNYEESSVNSNSSLYINSHGSGYGHTSNGSYNRYSIGFNASRSNSIYGNSTHVTPTNTSVLYIIKY